ncbi:hypothetical protein RRG08_064883, partial [Elysia crispata]
TDVSSSSRRHRRGTREQKRPGSATQGQTWSVSLWTREGLHATEDSVASA